MSYPPPSNYWGYYETAQQGQSMNNRYNSGQQSTPTNPYATQGSYADDGRRSQNSSSRQDWPAQEQQQNYANSSRQRIYNNDSWRNVSASIQAYSDRTQATIHAAQGNTGQDYYSQGSSAVAGQNTQGLNSLAYASGLEEGLQPPGHHAQKPQAPTSSGYAPAPASGATAIIRGPSPVAQRGSRYNASQPGSYSRENDVSGGQNQQPVLSAAAAALTGTVNRRYPQTSMPNAQSSDSPVTSSVRPAQSGSVETSTSPWYQPGQAQSQRRQSSGATQSRYANPNHPVNQQTSPHVQSGQHARLPSQTAPKPSDETGSVNNISNLVTPPDREPPHGQYSATVEPQHMPTYIDPSQVFNPFHKEHERRRREAAHAEAEAKKKAEEAEVKKRAAEEAKARRKVEEAEAKRKAEEAADVKRRGVEEAERQRRAAEEAELKQKAEEAAAALKRSEEERDAAAASVAAVQMAMRNPLHNAPSPSEGAIVSRNIANNGPQSDKAPVGMESHESEMASELKTMMEKMREFRSKDPGLFQKLWEDIRKITQGAPAPAAPLHTVSPQMTMQQPLPASQARPLPVAAASAQAQSPQLSQQRTYPNGHLHHPVTTGSTQMATSSTPASQQVQQHVAPTSNAGPVKPLKVIQHMVKPPKPSPSRTNGYQVVIEDNPEGLPDLGRFPAGRRIRSSYNKRRGSPASESRTQSAPQKAIGTSVKHGASHTPTPPSSTAPPATLSAVNAHPLTQALPPRGPGGGTVWPEEKRNALAEAAVSTLTSLPENAQIEISAPDIHAMLEKNPSYIDLCDMLEKRGLRFHRGQFARQLLSNVPYLNSAQSKAAPIPSPTLPSASSLVLVPAPPAQSRPMPPVTGQQIPAPTALILWPQPQVSAGPPAPIPARQFVPPSAPMLPSYNAPGRPPNTMTVPNRMHGIVFQSVRPALPPTQFIQVRQPLKSATVGPARAEPPPGSKEAKARKRDFSELVDLTALSDNEDYVLSRKQARIESASPEPDPFQEYQRRMSTGQNAGTTAQRLEPEQPAQLQSGIPLIFNPMQPFTPLQQQSSAPPLAHPVLHQRTTVILARPLNKEEALQKHYYDAKTVARDILIAAGRHPTERPLNAHMAGLLGKHVELDSDLGTFDWDAIDPGGPAIPQIPFTDSPAEPPRYQLGQHGIRRPDMDIRTKVRLPDLGKRKGPAPAPAVARDAVAGRAGQRQRAPSPPIQVSTDLGPSHVRKPPSERVKDVQTSKSVAPQKRRASLNPPSGPPDASQRGSPGPRSARRDSSVRPDSMSSGTFFPSGKRRGRPPGTKKLLPAAGANSAAKRLPAESVTASPTTPSHPIFRCRWKGCRAHLHNLETLRNHVSKVHRPPQDELDAGGYACWWKNCQLLKVDEEGAIYPERSFQASEEWADHIEKDHLYPVALKYGDGPSTKSIDPQTILHDRTRYLSDEHGRITTPDVCNKSPGDLESDTMTLLKADHDKTEQQAQHSFLKTHRTEKSSPKAVAEETLKAMSARKAKIGPGLDRGGCILVNEARRPTLIQNQGLQRVVDIGY